MPTDTDAPSRANPPPKRWSLPASLALIALGMPAMFYLKFGYVDGYGYGFTAFLMLLALAVELIPPRADQAALEEPSKVPPSRFDFLGVVWLLSVPFAPFFSWLLTNAFEVGLSNWRTLHAIRAVMCIPIPILCALPLLRYLRRPHVGFMLAVLCLGTSFPVVTALSSAIDVVRGPVWQNVNITDLTNIDFRTQAGTRVKVPQAFIYLEDGRKLNRLTSVPAELHRGPARLLVLRSLGQVLDAHQE